MNIEFILPIPGVPKGRPRHTRSGRTYTPAETRKFEAFVKGKAERVMAELGAQPVEDQGLAVTLSFFFTPPASWTKRRKREVLELGAVPKITKPDIDNLGKAVLDGMNGAVYKDDCVVWDLHCLKLLSFAQGGTVHVSVITKEKCA